MTHPEIEELLASYALDAVSPEEATELEQHLAECPRCRAELAAHRAVAGVLGNLSGTAPAGLWDRIAEELAIGSSGSLMSARLQEATPEPPALGELRSGRATSAISDNDAQGSLADDTVDGEDDESAAVPAPVIAIGSARPLRPVASGPSGTSGRSGSPQRGGHRYALLGVAVSVAVALAIVVGALSAKVVNLDHQVNALSIAVLNPGVAAQATAAANDPQHVTVDLTAAGSAWSAKVVALPGGEAFLVPGKMPAIRSNQTFQAWALVGGKFVSLGVIGPAGAEMQLQPSMRAIVVNTEPQGGTSQPTTTPFIRGNLPKSF